MADSISNVSTKITADPSGFVRGFQTADASLKSFQQNVSPLTTSLNNLNSAFTGVNLGGFAGRFSSLVAPVGNLVANMGSRNFAGAAQDVVSLIQGFGSLGFEAAKTASSQARLADTLGFTQSGFQGLVIASGRMGMELDDVTHIASKFNSAIGEMRLQLARGEVSPLARTFRGLGIDVREFLNSDSMRQWSTFANSIQRVANRQDRRFILTGVFGNREAETASRVFGRDGSFFQNAENDALSRGLVLRQEQIAQLHEANRAQRELNIEMEILWAKIGRAVSFVTTPLANAVTSSLRPGTLENQFWQSAVNPFGVFDSAPINHSSGLARERELEQERADKLSTKYTSKEQLAQYKTETEGPDRELANRAAGELLETLERQGQAIGVSTVEAEILRRNLDSLNPILANQLRTQERINERRQQQTQQAAQVRAFTESLNPMLRFQRTLQDLRDNSGLTDEQRRAGAFQAVQQMESSLPRFELRYAGASRMGSSEAASVITQARAQQIDSQRSPQERLDTLMQQARDSTARTEQMIRGFTDAIQRNGFIIAPDAN